MIRYTCRLHGPAIRGARINAMLLREIVDVLSEGARGALRLRVEGRSFAGGATPSWLSAAADFDVIAIEDGSTVLVLEAPSLADAAGGPLSQTNLFQSLDVTESALSLVQESLADALGGNEDSELFDNALLARFDNLSRVFARGVDRVELSNGRAGGPTTTIVPERMEDLRRLRRETPPEQRVRVSGWLDQIRHSDRMFTVKLESGVVLRGVAEEVDAEKLASLWGKKAVISGMAVFRPSGKILRLEADDISSAGADFSFWSVEPKPLSGGQLPPIRVPQGPRVGVNAIIGQWPGDETDEEVAQALEAMS